MLHYQEINVNISKKDDKEISEPAKDFYIEIVYHFIHCSNYGKTASADGILSNFHQNQLTKDYIIIIKNGLFLKY